MTPSRSLGAAFSSFLFCMSLAAAASAQHGEVFPSDPRVVEANALLDDESQWDRAVALYRAALADDPGDVDSRVWLARVLSWKGEYDESLVQYDVLLEMEPPPPGIEVERIEVVSWGGRYDEAQAAFEHLLEEDPENVRAWVGLARVHKWAGRRSNAYDSYKRALALGDDHETQHEGEELVESLEWFVELDTEYFNDSEGFEMVRGGIRAGADIDFDTRVFTRLGHVRARRGGRCWTSPPAPDGALRVDYTGNLFDPSTWVFESFSGYDCEGFFTSFTTPRRDSAFDILGGVEQQLLSSLLIRVQGGARIWNHAKTFPMATAEIEYGFDEQTRFGFKVDRQDLLDMTFSLEAVEAGVGATNLRTWAWRGWTRQLSSFLWIEGSFVDKPDPGLSNTVLGDLTEFVDGIEVGFTPQVTELELWQDWLCPGAESLSDPVCRDVLDPSTNQRFATGTSLTWTPIERWDLSLVVSANYLHFSQSSVYYFAPLHDVSGSVGISGSIRIYRFLRFTYEGRIGGGYTKEFDVGSAGLIYTVAGGPALEHRGWSFSAYGFNSQTRRANAYVSWGFGLNLGRSF